MSDSSPNLALPLIQAAQAQKHVTHNEAIALLDALAQLVVQDLAAVTPPEAPQDGQVWLLGTAAAGEWTGQEGRLAAWLNGGWVFVTPQPGWIAVQADSAVLRVFGPQGWSGPSLADIGGLGIGATADDYNRLIVASPATLLTHAGWDHRVTINKADVEATGSLVFQNAYSGRAEMGLAGEDAFTVKVSPDGGVWTTALRVDPTLGTVSGAAVQETPDDTTPGRLMRADYGYGPGNAVGPVGFANGVPTGAIVESGAEGAGSYVRFADGTQICMGALDATALDLDAPRAGGFAATLPAVDFAQPFTAPPTVSVALVDDAQALLLGASGTLTAVVASVWSAVSDPVDIAGRYLAVGRWS